MASANGEFPRTIKRGPLKGQHFDTEAEYVEARAAVDAADTAPMVDGDGSSLLGAPGAPASAPRRSRTPKGRVSKEQVFAVLYPLNIGLYMVPPTRQDALNDEELNALCEAIAKVAAVNKHVERAILGVVEGSAYVELLIVVAAIGIKRAAIHGLLPREVGGTIGTFMGLGEMPPEPDARFGARHTVPKDVPQYGPQDGQPNGHVATPSGLIVPDIGELSRT